MKDKLDFMLKQALTPTEEADFRVNRRILNQSREDNRMKWSKRRMPVAVLASMAVVVMGSVGVYAVSRFMTPSDVAENVGDTKLAAAFESEDAVSINETQQCGEYDVTLLGMISGSDLADFSLEIGGEINNDKTYAVTAISRADGTEFTESEYMEKDFFVSPYVQNLNPNLNNIASMNGGAVAFVEDGILYRLVACDNVEIFAKNTIYLGVSDGTLYNEDAYIYDEQTGEISRNEAYDGVNALFVLPIDSSLGDDAAVEEYLKSKETNEGATESTEADVERFFYGTYEDGNLTDLVDGIDY